MVWTKMKIRWCMLDVCLTSPWHMLDNLDIYIVCLEGMQTAEAEQQRLSGVFFTMMLLSFLSEEVYFPCVLLLSFRWLSVLSHVLSESINKINDYKCLWRPASPSFILWQACQQERCRKDRQAWMKVLISLHCVRTFVAEQGQWKPHENLICEN